MNQAKKPDKEGNRGWFLNVRGRSGFQLGTDEDVDEEGNPANPVIIKRPSRYQGAEGQGARTMLIRILAAKDVEVFKSAKASIEQGWLVNNLLDVVKETKEVEGKPKPVYWSRKEIEEFLVLEKVELTEEQEDTLLMAGREIKESTSEDRKAAILDARKKAEAENLFKVNKAKDFLAGYRRRMHENVAGKSSPELRSPITIYKKKNETTGEMEESVQIQVSVGEGSPNPKMNTMFFERKTEGTGEDGKPMYKLKRIPGGADDIRAGDRIVGRFGISRRWKSGGQTGVTFWAKLIARTGSSGGGGRDDVMEDFSFSVSGGDAAIKVEEDDGEAETGGGYNTTAEQQTPADEFANQDINTFSMDMGGYEEEDVAAPPSKPATSGFGVTRKRGRHAAEDDEEDDEESSPSKRTSSGLGVAEEEE